jgi:DNA topoisomerase-1
MRPQVILRAMAASPAISLIPAPEVSARAAGLRYVSDGAPGIRRKRAGEGFAYVGPGGGPIRSPETLARIKSLAIPPAWTDVWICPFSNGHLQATGRDAKGRKQYRYHNRWRTVRDETKYNRMAAFGRALGRLRARVDRDLSLPGLPRERVLAAAVRLLDSTMVRIGNPEYVRQNDSFGLTTLRSRHARINGSKIRFRFNGKGAKEHQIEVADRRLSRLVKRCQELPGQELFQYLDEEGVPQSICSLDVNRYLRQAAGKAFTAKDFRTWAGSAIALEALRGLSFSSQAEAKRHLNAAISAAADRLGNTPAICKKCYVHPSVVEAFSEGRLDECWERASRLRARGLDEAERALLALLEAEREQPPNPQEKPLSLTEALKRSIAAASS